MPSHTTLALGASQVGIPIRSLCARLLGPFVFALLVYAGSSPAIAQAQEEDSLTAAFMQRIGLDQRQGAWFREYRVDPMFDSVTVHQWMTFAIDSMYGRFRHPFMSVVLTLACTPTPPTFVLTADDSTLALAESDVWVRYRVDQQPASRWQRAQGRVGGHLIIAALDSASSADLRDRLVAGREKVLVRVRAGLTGQQVDFRFFTNGFQRAYLECLTADKH